MYEKETHVVRLLGLEEMGGASKGTKVLYGSVTWVRRVTVVVEHRM